MMKEMTIEQVRAFFAKDRFATGNGAVIDEIGDHSAVCSINITDSHKNAMGAVMGGVYFTLADFAFAVATNWQHVGTVSLSSTITYMNAAKGDTLIAKANCVKEGKTTSYYEVNLYDNLDNHVAAFTGVGYHVKA